MLRRFGILGCLCLSGAGNAQRPAVTSLPGVDVQIEKSTNLAENPEGRYLVTNESQPAIVALHFSYGCGDLETWQLFDVLVEYGARPIERQQTWSSTFSTPDILNCPGGVDAVVFADGRTEGAPQKVAEIYHERRGVYEGISFVFPLLDTVVKSEAQKDEALRAMSEKVAEMGNNPASDRDRPALWGETFLLHVVADCLGKGLPMGSPSDMRPSEEAVEQVMRSEHLSHTSAAAYAIRARLLIWQGDLAGNLGMRRQNRWASSISDNPASSRAP